MDTVKMLNIVLVSVNIIPSFSISLPLIHDEILPTAHLSFNQRVEH